MDFWLNHTFCLFYLIPIRFIGESNVSYYFDIQSVEIPIITAFKGENKSIFSNENLPSVDE